MGRRFWIVRGVRRGRGPLDGFFFFSFVLFCLCLLKLRFDLVWFGLGLISGRWLRVLDIGPHGWMLGV